MFKGEVEVYTGGSGVWSMARRFNNGVTATGYSLMARSMGEPGICVNGMYALYKNGAVDESEPSLDFDATPAWFNAFGASYGYVRIPTLSRPEYSSTSTTYNGAPFQLSGNKATFFAVADAGQSRGAALIDGLSTFFLVSLAHCPDWSSDEGDVLVSGGLIKNGSALAPVQKIVNSQIAFRWSLTFKP
jgi:hypothetical protein